MYDAPINVKKGAPTDPPVGWANQGSQWKTLNETPIQGRIGNPGFFPLTIKFGYVFGIIYNIWQSVACLLENKDFAKESSYIPAYGLFASGIELLGRCVAGEDQVRRSTLKPGLQWLKKQEYPGYTGVKDDEVLAYTSTKTDGYSISQLRFLRHFAAHGQGTSDYQTVDYELIDALREPLTNGLETYWWYLQRNDAVCNNLAKANIVPLHKSAVMQTWWLFEGRPNRPSPSITGLLGKFKGSFQV